MFEEKLNKNIDLTLSTGENIKFNIGHKNNKFKNIFQIKILNLMIKTKI